jgi:hypothetical protein
LDHLDGRNGQASGDREEKRGTPSRERDAVVASVGVVAEEGLEDGVGAPHEGQPESTGMGSHLFSPHNSSIIMGSHLMCSAVTIVAL